MLGMVRCPDNPFAEILLASFGVYFYIQMINNTTDTHNSQQDNDDI